jgi:hypothetical protein
MKTARKKTKSHMCSQRQRKSTFESTLEDEIYGNPCSTGKETCFSRCPIGILQMINLLLTFECWKSAGGCDAEVGKYLYLIAGRKTNVNVCNLINRCYSQELNRAELMRRNLQIDKSLPWVEDELNAKEVKHQRDFEEKETFSKDETNPGKRWNNSLRFGVPWRNRSRKSSRGNFEISMK